MRPLLLPLSFLALGYAHLCVAQNAPRPMLPKNEIVRIAMQEAGCRTAADCEVTVRSDEDKSVVLVSFLEGRDARGNPVVKQGQWVGLTLNRDGKVISRVPAP